MLCHRCHGEIQPNGECKLCEMFASCTPPQCHTDNTLMNGGVENGRQFAKAEWAGDFYAKQAKKHGLKSTKGRIYMSRLAKFPGDPDAWIADKGDIQKLAEKRGMGINGYGLSIPMRNDVEPEPGIDIADDIVDREVTDILAANPEVAPTKKEKLDLREKVRNKRKPHWSKT